MLPGFQRRALSLAVTLTLTLSVTLTMTLAAAGSAFALDTTSAAGQQEAYVRMRASSDGRDAFANWWVTVFAVMPGEKPRAILRMDGYNVGRFAKQEDGSVNFISREVAYYKDLASGKIIEEWANPYTNEKNAVLQVANDPVNSRMAAPKAGEAGRMPFRVSGNDVMLLMDVPLAYPNALLPAEFPAESTGPTYLASEHFSFFARANELDDSKTASVPITYNWTRTGPWLPWMKMGTRAGYLLYSGHGKKFASFAELPADVRAYTLANFPQYLTSPSSYATPNETSWTYYKKIVRAKPQS